MTRSRDHGRAHTEDRPAADYQTGPSPPADAPVLKCACGAVYRDYDASREAHKTVHGHRPITKAQQQQ